jgi:hypothetical protein
MCYSPRASAFAFITSTISSYVLYRNSIPREQFLGVFFMYIGGVQLYDWILWKNQDNDVNVIVTKLQMFHVLFEPVLLAGLIYNYTGNLGIKSAIGTGIYAINTGVYVYKNLLEPEYTEITQSEEGKNELIWKWNNKRDRNAILTNSLFVLSFAMLGYEGIAYPKNILFTTFLLSSLSFSVLFKNQIGRYWCKIGSFAPFLFLWRRP